MRTRTKSVFLILVLGSINFQSIDSSHAALYAFSNFTFTSCGVSGQTGPSQSNCRSAYSSASWAQVDANFTVSAGIQSWTVPESGAYTINAVGAGGGNSTYGGRGASMSGRFVLNQGDVLKILVGQTGASVIEGTSTRYGAGGGSFVIKSPSTPLIVAGGGGGSAILGAGWTPNVAGDGSTNPNPGYSTGGTADPNPGGCGGAGQGGAGYNNNGTGVTPSKAFTNGGNGGTGGAEQCPASIGGTPFGGFGGGGGGGNGGGGGGGYFGGNGNGSYSSTYKSGAGGGSYNSGSSQNNLVASNRFTNGTIAISFLGSLNSSTTINLTSNVASATYRTTISITATVDQPGKVTFYSKGKRIAGCIGIPVVSNTASCNWKPTQRGSQTISATLNPNNGYESSSGQLSVTVVSRTDAR